MIDLFLNFHRLFEDLQLLEDGLKALDFLKCGIQTKVSLIHLLKKRNASVDNI